MQTVAPKAVRCVLFLVIFVGLSGCYSHGYQRRSAVAPNSFVAIDEQKPIETTKWSYLWGLANDAPYAPAPGECDGKGAGKVDVTVPWYGTPLMLITLGIVMPARVIVYCNTESAPATGP